MQSNRLIVSGFSRLNVFLIRKGTPPRPHPSLLSLAAASFSPPAQTFRSFVNACNTYDRRVHKVCLRTAARISALSNKSIKQAACTNNISILTVALYHIGLRLQVTKTGKMYVNSFFKVNKLVNYQALLNYSANPDATYHDSVICRFRQCWLWSNKGE